MSGSEDDGARGDRARPDSRVLLEALTGQLQQLMRRMDNMQDTVGRIEAEQNRRPNDGRGDQRAPRQPRAEPYPRRNYGEEDFEEFDYDEGGADRRRYEQGRRDNRREDDNLGSIKSKIPEFKGRNDPEAYLEWEKRIENVFDIHHYSDRKKGKTRSH